MSARVAVVGAGSWGTTLAKILAENGHHVLLGCRREECRREIAEAHTNERYLPGVRLPEGVEPTTDLPRACAERRLLFVAVPSDVFREVARQLGPHLSGEHVVVHATKGIEQGSFKRMSEILREETPVRRIGVLTGPNLAPELARQAPAGALVASRYDEVFHLAHEVLQNGYFRVYGGRDLVGAEIGGTMTNILSLAAGVVDGLGMGDNTKGLLVARGLAELARLGAALGAEPMTFFGMAGIGDAVAACGSRLSRNHQVGERLARGEALGAILADLRMVAEGVNAARAVGALAASRKLELPIVRGVSRLLFEGAPAAEVAAGLVSQCTGRELEGIKP